MHKANARIGMRVQVQQSFGGDTWPGHEGVILVISPWLDEARIRDDYGTELIFDFADLQPALDPELDSDR
jgi:hypothetical protein